MKSTEDEVKFEEEACDVAVENECEAFDEHTTANYEMDASNHQSQSHPQSKSHSKVQEEKNLRDDFQLMESGDPESTDVTRGPKKKGIMAAASSKALRPFVIISSSYLLFTITDGAIRMIVLLHAYNKNFSALEVSIMFSLYELAGVFTNLVSRETVRRETVRLGEAILYDSSSLHILTYVLLNVS